MWGGGFWKSRGVMVIIIRNGLGGLSSNPRCRCLHFRYANTPGKDMNPTLLPLQWVCSWAH